MTVDERLQDLLEKYESLRAAGTPTSPEELCAGRPELVDELARLIADLAKFDSPVGDRRPADSPRTPPLDPGGNKESPQSIGRYRLESKLGEGGFGEVWRAVDPVLNRGVAIKFPRSDRKWTPGQIDEFLEEARRVARLEHPGILPVYDVNSDGSTCYVVSMLVGGGDLARYSRGGLPARVSAVIVADVAEALHHAHLRGFVHRDVKPANVLVGENRRTLLADFGLAATEDDLQAEAAGLRGTLAYMSPEQARGDSHRVDPRADIYALGVVLYELLVGRRPFRAANWSALRDQILHSEARPLRTVDDNVPRDLERICLRCLEKRPGDRYSTARDLAEELRSWLAREEKPPSAATQSWAARLSPPLNFSTELARLGKHFTGRAWLDSELAAWIAGSPSRMFLVTGDPGTGKSAYLAHVIRTNRHATAHHFCVAGVAESLDPGRFVESIASQLADRIPDFRPPAADGATVAEIDPGSQFRRFVVDPLHLLPEPAEPLLIVVDALDEGFADESNVARLLRDRIDDLPSWVRFLVSTRKEPLVLESFGDVPVREIEGERPENVRDLADYLESVGKEPSWKATINRLGADSTKTLRAIAERAAGNFLYARQTVEAIRSGYLDPGRPDQFPDGLGGIYQKFFEKSFPTPGDFDAIRPVLDLLCAACSPLSTDDLAEFSGRDAFEVETVLQGLAVLFPKSGSVYRPCHKSLTDWLCGRGKNRKAFRINVAAGHRQLAVALLARYRSKRRDDFVLSYLPTHLREASRWDDLDEILADPEYVSLRCRRGQAFGLIADYAAALERWPDHRTYDPFGPAPAPPPARSRESIASVLGRPTSAANNFGAVPVLEALRTLADTARERSVPETSEELATEPTPQPAVGGVPLIDSMREAEATSRDGIEPSADVGPAARVAAFAEFVATHVHFLAAHPQETIPLAANSADSGPVASRAEILASTIARPWLKRENRPAPPPSRAACLRVLRGHTDQVLAVSLDGAGRLAVSGSDDHAVRVWDVATGECVAALAGHTGPVNAVAFSSDGSVVASVGKDASVRIWRFGRSAESRVLRGHFGAVYCVALSADGRLAATGGRDRTVRLWDTETGECLRWMAGHTSPVLGVAATPDGQLVASTDWAGYLRLWDARSGQFLRQIRGHTRPVKAVAISHDGRSVVTGGMGKTVRLWDVVTAEPRATLVGHRDGVLGVALAERILVSVGSDRTLRVWDAVDSTSIRTIPVGTSYSVGLSANGRLAATAESDHSVRIWDLANGIVSADSIPPTPVQGFAWSSDGDAVVTAGRDGMVRLWDADARRCVRVLKGHTGVVQRVAVRPDGAQVLSGGWDATVRVWHFVTGFCAAVFEGHTGEIRDLAVSPDGKLAASASEDNTVRLWEIGDLATRGSTTGGRCLAVLDQGVCATSVAFSSDGSKLAVGTADGEIALWETLSANLESTGNEPMARVHGHATAVTSLSFSPNGEFASASADRTVRVWDATGRTCLGVLRGHTANVSAAIFDGGQRLLTGSDDGTVRLWDSRGWKCECVYHAGDVVRSLVRLGASRFACGTQSGRVQRMSTA